MSHLNNLETVFTNAASTVLTQIAAFFPKVLAAVIIFTIGALIAKWAKRLTSTLVRAVKLEKIFKNTSVETFLQKAELPHGLDDLLGEVVKWIIILIFFISTVNLLGLTAVSQVLGSILAYIPNVIAATLILAVGILVAGLLEGVVKSSLADFHGHTARLLGKVTSYTIMVFALLAAISQLRIAEQFIYIIFTGFVATLALGIGLSIGLGAKDIVGELIRRWYEKIK